MPKIFCYLFSFVPSILKITERDLGMKSDMLNILFHTKYRGNLLYCNGLILNSSKNKKKCKSTCSYQGINNFFDCVMTETFIKYFNPRQNCIINRLAFYICYVNTHTPEGIIDIPVKYTYII